MARILITGASGFIGRHLVEVLVARGDTVTCLVRPSSRVERLRTQGVRLACGDVADRESLRAAAAGQEFVYHLAGCTGALQAEQYYRVNRDGAENIAAVCAAGSSPPVLVLVSSLAAAGPTPNGRPRTEADHLLPVSHYGRSKLAGEMAAAEFADRVPISIVRPAIVFGEGDRAFLPVFSGVARTGVHFVPGLARFHYSLIHAQDLAQLLILAAERGTRILPQRRNGASHGGNGTSPRRNGTLHRGNGHGPTQGCYYAACEEDVAYADLGRMIGQLGGRHHVALIPIATPLMWIVGATTELIAQLRRQPLYLQLDKVREAVAGSWTCSPQAAIDQLGFYPSVPLRDRLRQTMQWYQRQGWL